MHLRLPARCKPVKRLLPCEDEEIDPVTPESVSAAQEAMWRERYQVQLQTGVVITAEGKILLPTKGKES